MKVHTQNLIGIAAILFGLFMLGVVFEQGTNGQAALVPAGFVIGGIIVLVRARGASCESGQPSAGAERPDKCSQ